MSFPLSMPIAGPLSHPITQYEGWGASLQRMLFGNGEDGFLFYPASDLTRLFTTSVGPTNVAANDDTVGLWLDNHSWGGRTLAEELAAQPEVLTNGDFEDGSTGWTVTNTDGTHIATFSGGTLRFQSDTTSPVLTVAQPTALTIGKWYKITTVCSARASGSIKEGYSGVVLAAAVGTTVFYIKAGTDSFSIQRNSSNVDLTLASVSIKEVPGNHALNATGTQLPLYKTNAPFPYLHFDGTDDRLVSPFIPTTSLTLAVAVQAASTGVTQTAIGGGNTTGNIRAQLGLSGGGKATFGWGTDTMGTRIGATDITGALHVLLVTGNGSTVGLYTDGIADYEGASNGGPNGGTGVAIGCANTGSAFSFLNGRISAALALNRVVSPAEIARITSDFQRTFQ